MDGLLKKIGIGSIWFFLAAFARPSFAGTLAEMEAITARFPTLTEFLKDRKAVKAYREALKGYLDEGTAFDWVYDEFIRQISDVNKQVVTFGEKAWRPNPNWQKDTFKLEGTAAGSGLEINREVLLTAIEQLKTELGNAANEVSKAGELESLGAELRTVYQLQPPSVVKSFSNAQRAEYSRRLGGDAKKSIPRIAQHPAARKLSAYLASRELEHNEGLSDILYSGDADLIAKALQTLQKPSGFTTPLPEAVPPELLSYLNFLPPLGEQILEAYHTGIKATKDFRALADPKLNPELRRQHDEILKNGRAKNPSASQDDIFHAVAKWEMARQLMNNLKQSQAAADNAKNPYFRYELHHDPSRNNYRLKSDSGTELTFIPSPRPFHAFFAGRKTKECVGGRDCENLVVKRWVRGALEGSENLFTETGDGRMEGMIALTKLVNDQDGKTYDVVDLMSRAIKSTVLMVDSANRQIKYTLFDQFIDAYQKRLRSHGLVISDGNNVSQNVSGGEVVTISPAYAENRILGRPENFSPQDPMALEIAKKFPKTLVDYGKGGLIYDGMRGDGQKVVRLVPASERRKWTREELETDILLRLFSGVQIHDRDVVWKQARESGQALRAVSVYQKEVDEYPERIKKLVERELLDPLREYHPSPQADRALALIRVGLPNSPIATRLDEIAPGLLSRFVAQPSIDLYQILQTGALFNWEGFIPLMRDSILAQGEQSPFASLFRAVIKLENDRAQEYVAKMLETNPAPAATVYLTKLALDYIQGREEGSPLNAAFANAMIRALSLPEMESTRNALSFLKDAYRFRPRILPVSEEFNRYLSEQIAKPGRPDPLITMAATEVMKAYPRNLFLPPFYDVWLDAYPKNPKVFGAAIVAAIETTPKDRSLISTKLRDVIQTGLKSKKATHAGFILGAALKAHPADPSLLSPDTLEILGRNIRSLSGEKGALFALISAAPGNPTLQALFERWLRGNKFVPWEIQDHTVPHIAANAIWSAFTANPKSIDLQKFFWRCLTDPKLERVFDSLVAGDDKSYPVRHSDDFIPVEQALDIKGFRFANGNWTYLQALKDGLKNKFGTPEKCGSKLSALKKWWPFR